MRRSELEEVHRRVEQALAWLGVIPAGQGRAKGGAPRHLVRSLSADLDALWETLARDIEQSLHEKDGKAAVDDAALQSALVAFQSEFEQALTATIEEAVKAGIAHAADQLGQDVSFSPVDTGILEALQGQAINLCESTAAKIRGDVKHQLYECVRLGENLAQAIERLQSISSLTTYEAERIARTELAKAANAGRLMGYKGRASHVVWVLGPTYRGGCECAEFAGTYALEEAAGVPMPLHPNCDCYWRPATEDEAAA
jgi:hypothetical protein